MDNDGNEKLVIPAAASSLAQTFVSVFRIGDSYQRELNAGQRLGLTQQQIIARTALRSAARVATQLGAGAAGAVGGAFLANAPGAFVGGVSGALAGDEVANNAVDWAFGEQKP